MFGECERRRARFSKALAVSTSRTHRYVAIARSDWVRRFERGDCSPSQFAAGGPSGEVIFLDDNAINVERAAALGFDSYRAQGVEETAGALAELGFEL